MPSTALNRSSTRFKLASSYASKRLDTIQKLKEKMEVSIESEEKNTFINKKLQKFSPSSVLLQSFFSVQKPGTPIKVNNFVTKSITRFKDRLLINN